MCDAKIPEVLSHSEKSRYMDRGTRGIITTNTTNDYLFIALQVEPPCVGELAWSTLTVTITAPKCQNRGPGHRPNTGTASLYKHSSCLHTLFANSLFCFIIHSILTNIYTGQSMT